MPTLAISPLPTPTRNALQALSFNDWTGGGKIGGLVLCLSGALLMATWSGPALVTGGHGLLQGVYAEMGIVQGGEASKPRSLPLGCLAMVRKAGAGELRWGEWRLPPPRFRRSRAGRGGGRVRR